MCWGYERSKRVLDRNRGKKMFGKKKEHNEVIFDPSKQIAILRCSICNGEQVACFKNMETGEIQEIALIREEKELHEFMKQYGISKITKVY